MFTDGSSCAHGSGVGLILTNLEGMEFTYALRFRLDATNNEAEYEALIARLKIAEQIGVENLPTNVTHGLHARRHTIRRGKGLADWLLLANHAQGRKKVNSSMSRLPSSQACPKNPQQRLPKSHLMPSTKWGIDIARPFLEGPESQILDSSYRLLHKVDRSQAGCNHYWKPDKKFVWYNIVCRFGLPGEIISDNGKQFQDNPFKDCKNWMEELPHVLWAHRTMIKSCNGDTPFSLTYGTEAVIPAEIGMPTLRIAEINLEENREALEINLDLLEERREQTAIREAKSKAKMERYYNSKVQSVSFKPGDLVYRNNKASVLRYRK
ncbi:reverse transcriptase domain-containing protein [Tanacetum coccineum]